MREIAEGKKSSAMPEKRGKAKKVSLDLTPDLARLREAVVPPLVQYESMIRNLGVGVEGGVRPVRVLSLDPGQTNVAICFLDVEHGGVLTSKIELPDLTSTRFLYVERVVEHWIRMFRPDFIFKESPALGAEFGVADAGRFQYLIERLAIEYQIPLMTVGNTSMRSFINAPAKKGQKTQKGLVQLRVFQRFGREFATEDECDAFAIAQTGLAILSGEYVVNKKK